MLTPCRMFREPSEAPKSNAIKDSSATARSAIRRQASVRGRPGSRFRPSLYGAPYRSPFHRSLADELEREVDGLGFRLRSPLSNSSPLDGPPGTLYSFTDHEGQRLLNDAITHPHPGRRLRIPREIGQHGPRDHLSSNEGPGGSSNPEALPFTHRFAPAIAFHSTISAQPPPPYVVRSPPILRLDGAGEDQGSHIPLLRRVGQRSVNDARRSHREPTVDGLGDRQRSLSPDRDQGNDPWETLLTTITPDANLPSADSSFTSASASATNGSRDGTSANSSQTLPSSFDSAAPTMHMVLDPYPEYFNPCDFSSSDSEAEPDSDPSHRQFYRNYHTHLQRAARSADAYGSAMGRRPPIPTASVTFPNPAINPDVQHHLQSIMEQLAQRENVPDILWATAGLPPASHRRTGTTNDQAPDGTDGPGRHRL